MLLLVNKVYFSPLNAELPLYVWEKKGNLGPLEHTFVSESSRPRIFSQIPSGLSGVTKSSHTPLMASSHSEGSCPLNLVLSLASVSVAVPLFPHSLLGLAKVSKWNDGLNEMSARLH